MLWEYVREYLRVLDERRAQRLAALESEADFATLRDWVRSKLQSMWGEFPPRSPLNPRQIGTLELGNVAIERIIFESRPSFFVTANLYRPSKPAGPLPAVVFPCGHASDGKTAESYRRFCELLAAQGIAVLAWDPLGQGERLQFPDPETGESSFRPGSGEHRVLGDRCYQVGTNLMQFRAWDAVRALDYLESRPEFDASRFGIAGQSGGGMVTLQFACFDDRIRAAFVSCAVASFRSKTEALLMADPEQILYGTLGNGIDHPELLAAFAPKPLLIGAALRDYVPIEGTRATHAELQAVYAKLGAPGNLHMAETDATHGLNRELRESAAAFFLRTLLGQDRNPEESQAELGAADDLLCTETGQVSLSLASRSVADLNKERADRIAPRFSIPGNASEFDVYRSGIANRIREVTKVGAYKAEYGIEVPTRFLDAGVYAKGTAFLVAEQGKDHPAVRRYCIDAIVSADHSYFGLDLRGWGATKPDMPHIDADFDWDEFLAYRSLEIGRPLFGQRLKDLLATAPKMTMRREWTVVGIGIGGLVAAHAAALDPRISGVLSIQAPASFRSAFDDPHSTLPASCLLPGVLGAYDIRDVYAAVAPRPLLIVNPRDSRGRTLDPDAARSAFGWVAEMYDMLERPESLRIESELGQTEIRNLIGDWFGSLSS